MRKMLFAVLAVCCMIGLMSARVAMGNGALRDSSEDAIMVSPATIVLDKVSEVTVHTNVPAGLVDSADIDLNGVEPVEVWADNCGDLVARFAVADLELAPGEVELTLTALYADGTGAFSAMDAVTVK